jgi:aryl-alcohol dehydrogenase-like predicted oxidoreductase
MREVMLPGTGLKVSRFIFGTGSLHHLGRDTNAERLLDAAADHGFSHFDTAPYYGLGLGETLLGRLLRRRPHCTATTKVGLYPRLDGGTRLAMLAGKSAGRLIPPLSRPHADWSVRRAKVSLERSLRRLGRERIELLLLHEPDAALLDSDEWRRWLEEESRVLQFGLAGETEQLLPFARRRDPLARLLQTRDSLARREADAFGDRFPQITYGYVSSGNGGEARTTLEGAFKRQREGAVIVSTRRAERLALYAELAR